MTNDKIKLMAIKTALKDMFSSKSFSICTIDKCLKIANAMCDKETYQTMSALHCIDYADMDEELREWLIITSVTLFKQEGFDLSIIDTIAVEVMPKGKIIKIA